MSSSTNNGISGAVYAGYRDYLLHQSNIFYSGILDGMIDAQLAKEIGTTEIGNLKAGTQILIGDISWTKISDTEYLSEPITSTSAAKTAFAAAKSWKSSGDNKTYYNKMETALKKIYSDFIVQCDGRWTALDNYFSNATLGEVETLTVSNDTRLLYAKSSGEPVLSYYSTKKGKRIEKKKSSGFPKWKNSTAIVIKMQIDSSLLVTPVSADKSIYRYCSTASESLISGEDFDLFDASSYFETNNSNPIDLNVSSYEMTAAFNSMKDKYYDEFHNLTVQEVTQLLKIWIMVIASWLIVISWLIYWAFSRNGWLKVFGIISGQEVNGKSSGIDLVKIISLGLYNVNSPPDFKRVAVVTAVGLFVLLACIQI
jgi:hypothetical protein